MKFAQSARDLLKHFVTCVCMSQTSTQDFHCCDDTWRGEKGRERERKYAIVLIAGVLRNNRSAWLPFADE